MFLCGWKCFSTEEPPQSRSKVKSFIAIVNYRAKKAKQAQIDYDPNYPNEPTGPFPDETAAEWRVAPTLYIVEFAKCFAGCLVKNIPTNLIALGVFFFCLVGDCICNPKLIP